jgi:hypothetical protein
MIDCSSLSVAELLRLQSDIISNLRARKVLRSSNSPSGDYAELLFARAFGWKLQNNSSSGFDALDDFGCHYQIKCRRMTPENPSRQLSFIRNLPKRPFDRLAAVLLDASFRVYRAAIIPIEIVQEHATFVAHVNAWRFLLRDTVWQIDGVAEVTAELKAAEANIDL